MTIRLMRIGEPGAEQPVVLSEDGRAFDLRPITPDVDAALLAPAALADVREAVASGLLPEVSLKGVRVGPPVGRPASIICVGMNYEAHARESSAALPSDVVVFFKKPNTIVGPNDDVRSPIGAKCLDWEVELGVLIGRNCRYLASPDEALDTVAGYVLVNDVSERTFQIERSGGQWSKGKCAETFTPLGPWILTADTGLDPQDIRLRSWVNGEPRQDSSTADMIFSVAEVIHDLSKYMPLEAGDLICTGTPAGVALSGRFAYLTDGDLVRMEGAGLGAIEQRIRTVDLASVGSPS